MALIEFTEEQTMLLDTAAEFCRERSPISEVRAGLERPDHDAALWQQMVELGWLGIAVPEAHGGLGLGLAGTVPVVEAMGRQLLASPYFATTLAIHSLNTSADEALQGTYLPALAAGGIGTVALVEEDGNWLLEDLNATATETDGGFALHGRKCLVLDAQAADLLLVSVRLNDAPRLVLVTRDQLPREQLQREVVVDETRRSYSVNLDGVVVPSAQLLPGADFAALEHGALLLLAAEMSGGLAGVLATIVEYLTTRKQFDAYIGSYQSLKHPTVDILLAEEAAKSHLYHAATLLAQGAPTEDVDTALRIAKAHGSEAFAYAGDRAVQFHGGFGFTYDCDAQLYLRRALWCQHQFGDERHHRQRLAPALLDQTG